MYYIYHIPNVKWGCTNNLTRRKKQQSDYNITEWIEEEDLDKADTLEKQKNLEYGYSWDDSQSYKHMLSLNRSNGGTTSSLSKWKNNREKMMEQCFKAGETSKRKYSKKTLMCDLEGNVIKQFVNRREAADYVNGFKPNIILACREPHRTYKGYRWKNG